MIYCIVMGICAMFMFGIGLVQIKSKKPVAFYSGEKPPLEEKVKDIENWKKTWNYVDFIWNSYSYWDCRWINCR